MDEQMLQAVAAKAGIDAPTVRKVLDALHGFLRDNPDKLSEFTGGGGMPGEVGEKLGKFLKR